MIRRERWCSFLLIAFLFIVVPFISVCILTELQSSKLCYVGESAVVERNRVSEIHKDSAAPRSSTPNPLPFWFFPTETTTRPGKSKKKEAKDLSCIPSHIRATTSVQTLVDVAEAENVLSEFGCKRRNSLGEFVAARRRNESFLCPNWIVSELAYLELQVEQLSKRTFPITVSTEQFVKTRWSAVKRRNSPWKGAACANDIFERRDPQGGAYIERELEIYRHCSLREYERNCRSNRAKRETSSRKKGGFRKDAAVILKCTETIVAELIVMSFTSTALTTFLCVQLLRKTRKDRDVRYVFVPLTDGTTDRNESPPGYDSLVKCGDSGFNV